MKRFTFFDCFLIILSAALLASVTLPYPTLRSIGDSLAPDKNLERLTESAAEGFRIAAAIGSALSSAMIIWGIWDRKGRKSFLKSVLNLPKRCLKDAKAFFSDLRSFIKAAPAWSKIALLTVLILGTLLRWLFLDRPLLHDEAYTMFIWGRSDLAFALSDYQLPNNHLFNTLLINILYHLGARSAWMLRLPVFFSGILLIPSVWLLGKKMYNDFAGCVAAGFAAFSPFLVSYSVSARGYEFQALFTVITVGLAVYVIKKKNVFSWLLFILFSALNFFVLPTSVFPFGGICLWLFLEALLDPAISAAYSSKYQLLKYLAAACFCVVFLTVLLYIPLLKHSGFDSLFNNVFVRPLPVSSFIPTTLSRIRESIIIFFADIHPFTAILLAIGLAASVYVFKKRSSLFIPIVITQLIWLFIVLLTKRPNLWPRMVIYLYPLLFISAAAGLSWFFESKSLGIPVAILVSFSVIAAALPQFMDAFDNFGNAGSAERAIWQILAKEGYNAKDVYVAAVSEDNAPLWMYADFYGLPEKIFDRSKRFNTVYAFVNPFNRTENGPNTLDGVIAAEGPGEFFYDESSREMLLFRQDGVLFRFDGIDDVIERAYGG